MRNAPTLKAKKKGGICPGETEPMSPEMRIVPPLKRGIRGWELANPDPELFDTKIIEVFGACKACHAREMCDTPSESIRELAPKIGEIVELGAECNDEGETLCYYALLSSAEPKFILKREPRYQWARAFVIPEEQVPMNALSALSTRRSKEAADAR